MLYIFQVDTGQMLNFDMDMAISTVQALKSKIVEVQGIPFDKQVLLVSGGEILEGTARVCNYAAGTDTNPIFLFNKLNIEQGGSSGGGDSTINTMQQQQHSGSDNNVNLTDLETIHKQIQDAQSLPPTYMSVVTRTQLAQHIYDMGKELTRKCEVLIHHQHLQHQGWAAVIANLDDIVQVFNSRMGTFASAYESFFGEYSKESIDQFVEGLDNTLKTLDTIKLPHYTQEQPPDHHQQSIVQWLSEHFPTTMSTASSSTPLHSHLTSVATTTRNTHSHMSTPNFLHTLQQEASAVIEKASSPNMKEIKGLEERLYGLDQLLQEAKKIVVDQHELTQAFHQNVSRASDVRDSSIFPDLCASHQHQLLVMEKNHTQLEDIRRRCGRAKEELTFNLNQRLKWIAFVQKSLSEMGGKISVYGESLKRLRVHVNVLQQISTCEEVFGAYVREIQVRGRVGRKLEQLLDRILEFNRIVEGENRRRNEEFRDSYAAGHFLSQAFSVLVEDTQLDTVVVPKLVRYECGDEMEEDEEEQSCSRCNANNRAEQLQELSTKVQTLESNNEQLKQANDKLEDRLRTLEAQLEMQKSKSSRLQEDANSSRNEKHFEMDRANKLAAQVNDLKKLIDEFREQEEEVIRMHAEEKREYERKMRDVEEKCEQRVKESSNMMEYEWKEKLKALEDKHKMEYEAMVNRFKLVNRSVSMGGSNERISTPLLSPTTILANNPQITTTTSKRLFGPMDPNAAEAFLPRQVAPTRNCRRLAFSDEEEDEDEDEETDDYDEPMNSARSRRSEGMEEDDDCNNSGSLERAEDAVAYLDEGGKKQEGEQPARSDSIVVPERVIATANRLHKLSRISVSTCRVGGSEPNLFYWNERFNAFTVYLNNRNVHFLNYNNSGSSSSHTTNPSANTTSASVAVTSSLSSPPTTSSYFNSPSNNSSLAKQQRESNAALIRSLTKQQMFIGTITDKEFCVARRAQNRYNVPQGFHFYRVKCRVEEVLLDD